jgi:putative heme-binding domain-containing protein
VRPDGDLARLAPLLEAKSEPTRACALRLAGLWRVQTLHAMLLGTAAGDVPEAVRQAAFDGFVALEGKGAQQTLEEMATKERPFVLRRMAVIALASLDAERAAGRAVDLLTALPADADPTDLYAAFVQQKNGAAALVKVLAGQKLPADVAKVGVRTVRASGRDAPALIDALNKAGSLTVTKHVLAPQELQEMIAEVQKQGDPARGETVYRRKDQACVKCHAIAGAGGQVGPDLSSIGASAQVDYIIESILLPNKVIKENYHATIVTTKQGKIVTGIKVRESKTELVLRDAEDREVVIPAQDIDERANGGSLMPEGLADPLTHGELVDLVRFLAELGKVGPYAVGPARVVRRWQTLENTPEAGTLLRTTRLGTVATNDPALTWGPAYSQVSGILPLDGLPPVKITRESNPRSFVRCQLDVSTPGKVKLLLNGTAGVTAWLNGDPLEANETLELTLTAGVHTLTFALDRVARKDGLRCTLEDVPGSPARVRLVGGK